MRGIYYTVTPQVEISFLKMIPIVQQKHMLGVSFTAGDETPGPQSNTWQGIHPFHTIYISIL